jgi:hypothetical protein
VSHWLSGGKEVRMMQLIGMLDSPYINQAGISVAVAWHFTQQFLPEVVCAEAFPALREYSERAETLAEFIAAPHGTGTYQTSRV